MTSTTSPASRNYKVFGHVSATPESIAAALGCEVGFNTDSSLDAAIFAINPGAGLDQETVELWHSFDEVQMPRLLLVTVLEGMEMDFDDAVLLANRVLDTVVTPYLVLHGENGAPIGLISLEDLTTIDYSTNPPIKGESDSELTALVDEFRVEYLQQMEEMGDDAFAAGILFPAIPVNLQNGLGLDIVSRYLNQLPSGG